MVAAAKRVLTTDELALADVMPAVSTDETRLHLCRPFGREMHGVGYIVGTDGHRLHASAADGWRAHSREGQENPPPPADQVVPWDGKWLGEFSAAALDDARCFSARWDVALECGPNGFQRLFCSVRTGSGKKAKSVYPFGRDGVPVSWFKLEQLHFSFAVNLPYLLDAVDCVGTNVVHVWGGATGVAATKKGAQLGLENELAPLCFTTPRKTVVGAPRLAVVMPRRV